MIERIPKHYVSDDCVQINIHFLKTFTLIGSDFMNDGILCHYDLDGNSQNINKYLSDDRRHLFPYATIPIYKDFDFDFNEGVFHRVCVNQILEFNKHYISVVKDYIRDRYVVKDGKEALVLNRILYMPDNVREKIVEINKIFDFFTGEVLACVDKYGRHLDFKKQIKIFVENNGGLLVLNNNGNVEFKMVNIRTNSFVYYIKEFDIQFNDYKVEELKAFGSKIETIDEPRIFKRFNPNINRKDVKEAKKKVKQIRKYK